MRDFPRRVVHLAQFWWGHIAPVGRCLTVTHNYPGAVR